MCLFFVVVPIPVKATVSLDTDVPERTVHHGQLLMTFDIFKTSFQFLSSEPCRASCPGKAKKKWMKMWSEGNLVWGKPGSSVCSGRTYIVDFVGPSRILLPVEKSLVVSLFKILSLLLFGQSLPLRTQDGTKALYPSPPKSSRRARHSDLSHQEGNDRIAPFVLDFGLYVRPLLFEEQHVGIQRLLHIRLLLQLLLRRWSAFSLFLPATTKTDKQWCFKRQKSFKAAHSANFQARRVETDKTKKTVSSSLGVFVQVRVRTAWRKRVAPDPDLLWSLGVCNTGDGKIMK